MGKSPGKWIKTVLFGKKSSKSNLSKDATIIKNTSITRKPKSKDFDDDSMVISSPVPHVMYARGEHTGLQKTASTNLTSDTVEVVRSNLGLNAANEDEFIRLEQAVTMAQAAFRGYLARRAFCALKGRLVNTSEQEKPEPTLRKVPSQKTESVQEQSHSELEKVKQSLRKISVSTVRPPEKPETATEKLEISLDKASGSPNPSASDQGTDQPFEKVNDLNDVMAVLPQPEPLPVPPLEEDKVKQHKVMQDDDDDDHPVETDPPEINGKECNSSKENQKTRRKSFPLKEEHHPESMLQTTPTLPSYMAATESVKAKLRVQAVEDGAENGFVRRHSLPSSTGRLSFQSPRVQKPLQANVKGWTKSNKSQISARDDKMLQTGWKR
ncbi:hypothetical protein L1987_05483 [Smallanthus sonchifolius]|uniref:Uncharacterized protein n=1 Tax=Smallanthus sonchifolius TaxID=185202 RepID=A0ACB9JVI7_9ASTR|nr:hypothetical protein L1987_05483 [Smallanthus sonchifolius]